MSPTERSAKSGGSTDLKSVSAEKIEQPTSTSTLWKTIKSLNPFHRDIPQMSLVDIEESDAPKKIIYKQTVARHSRDPYVVKFENPKNLICGIACVPKNENTPSPDVEILRGGIGFNFVEIRLTPISKGYWSCCIDILGKETN